MYWPKPGIKKDPEKRWNQPDRIFFGFGACHILAGVYLQKKPLDGFYGEWIVPHEGFSGHHMYVTDGHLAFDFHGYSLRENLLNHFRSGWSKKYPRWQADIKSIDFPLLDTVELNRRKHLGPDQYWGDPVERAQRFLNDIDHKRAAAKAIQSEPVC
ncbi:hypothetical protein ACMG4P_11780 [Pseudovibrio denitrificans]|uniref:hypothetical protein n=1 Tax=Pseudovibrio denitrificans TaxID=258256 RepID=UPI0039BF7362